MDTVLTQLLQSLDSKDSTTREGALRDASALPFRAKLQLFRMAAERYRRQRRRYAMRGGAYIAIFIFAICASPWVPSDWLLPLLIAGFVVNSIWNRSPEQARQQMALLGQNINDPRFVLPVLKLLYGPEMEKPDPVLTDVLKRLLPQLTLRDAKRWSREEKALLLEPLENRSDPELTLCMLKALEQVGDEDAAPLVRKLAAMRLYDERIALAARDCLPYLYSNTQQLRQAQTLLRASEARVQTAETLLRPAHAAPANEPSDELLRSSRVEPYGFELKRKT
jgi:hypothetical protein